MKPGTSAKALLGPSFHTSPAFDTGSPLLPWRLPFFLFPRFTDYFSLFPLGLQRAQRGEWREEAPPGREGTKNCTEQPWMSWVSTATASRSSGSKVHGGPFGCSSLIIPLLPGGTFLRVGLAHKRENQQYLCMTQEASHCPFSPVLKVLWASLAGPLGGQCPDFPPA